MPTPQQPSLHGPDTAPPEQQPGHHPESEQDKPDMDRFAERLGVRTEGDEPSGAPNVTDADTVGPPVWKSQWAKIAVPAAIAAGLALVGWRRARR